MAVKINKMFLLFVLILSTILISVFAVPTYNSYASISSYNGIEYTNVIEDLEKDTSFSLDSYPLNEKDYSLRVIQIAESENAELFVYVYQPCSPNSDLQATSINISTNEGASYTNWDLELLNFSGTLYKYKVKNFTVLNTPIRYYDITSIYRAWNSKYDSEVEDNNTVSEVPFIVAKQWKVETKEDTVVYDCVDIDVIEILDKYVGFVRYDGGYTWDALTYESADNHFVAFTTDKPIDCLLEAELTYTTRTYDYYYEESMVELTSPQITYGEKIKKEITLTYDEEEDYKGNVFHKRYKWNKISSVNDFIENVEDEEVYHVIVGDVRKVVSWTTEGLNEIKGKQWVLRFDTTDYTYKQVGFSGITSVTTTESLTQVMDVSILRLKFRTDGDFYNLGVIDNKQTGDGEPDNETNTSFDWADWVKILFYLFLFVVLAVVLSPILSVIVTLLFNLIVLIVKFLWKIICYPFKLVKSIFKKKDKK